MDVIAARSLNLLYVYLDIVWLIAYTLMLIRFRKRTALIVGLLAGMVYFIVDYGYFYLLSGTRQVSGADPFWFLLWLSMSYGFTNFAWIWLLLDRDGRAAEWSALTILGWIGVAFLSQSFGAGFPVVEIQRTTNAYHGGMALILLVGYLIVIYRNLRGHHKVDILRLMAIGIGVQFSWESVLLVSGIRPAGILPLVVNSLIETNLGLPYAYYIHRALKRRFGG